MWNVFKRKTQPVVDPQAALAAALQGMKAAQQEQDEAQRPYGNTRIGFGANIARL